MLEIDNRVSDGHSIVHTKEPHEIWSQDRRRNEQHAIDPFNVNMTGTVSTTGSPWPLDFAFLGSS